MMQYQDDRIAASKNVNCWQIINPQKYNPHVKLFLYTQILKCNYKNCKHKAISANAIKKLLKTGVLVPLSILLIAMVWSVNNFINCFSYKILSIFSCKIIPFLWRLFLAFELQNFRLLCNLESVFPTFFYKNVALIQITCRNKETYRKSHIYISRSVWTLIFHILTPHTLTLSLKKYQIYALLLQILRLLLPEFFWHKNTKTTQKKMIIICWKQSKIT